MKIGACWIKKSSTNNETYLSCALEIVPVELMLGSKNFALFKNKEKKKAEQPDYIISFNPQKPSNTQSNNNSYGDFEDDIPF